MTATTKPEVSLDASSSKTKAARIGAVLLAPQGALSTKEAAAFIGIGQTYLFKLIKDPTSGLRPRKLGKRLLFLRYEVDRFLESLPYASTAPTL